MPANNDQHRAHHTHMLRWTIAAALIIGHLAAIASVAFEVSFVADEPGYIVAGHAIVHEGEWATLQERLHGPLTFVASQLFAPDLAADPTYEQLAEARGSFRLGMLPFSLLLVLATWRFAHDLWGSRGGLLALTFAAASPMLIGYGGLVISDIAFAATAITTLWLLWRWMRSPSFSAALVWGVALGACLATKYLALILAVGIVFAVAIAVGIRQFDPRSRLDQPLTAPQPLWARAVGTLLHLALAGCAALFVLHASYGFLVKPFDPAHTGGLLSPILQRIEATPIANWSLRILPEPMVVGADYQAYASSGLRSQFAGRNSGHWIYYLATVLTKSTVPLLLAAAVGVCLAISRDRVRFLGTALLVPIGVLLFYLSFINKIQVGVRYVLVAYPMLALFTGAMLRNRRRGRRRVLPFALAGILLWSFGVVVTTWPHYLGYFNPTIGGPAGGHRLFHDSNCEWGQNFAAPRGILRERHPGIEFLESADGPRFGRLAVYTPDFGRADPDDAARTYHWATRFEPIDSWSAAWLIFDLDEADFEIAIRHGDLRAATDLILAWLRADNFDRAAATLDAVAPTDRDARVVELVESWRTARTDPAAANEARRRIVALLTELGRPNLALAWMGELDGVSQFEMFFALWSSGSPREAVQWLQKRDENGSLSPRQAWLLAAGLAEFSEFEKAAKVLKRHPTPDDKDPLMPIYRKLRNTIDTKAAALRARQTSDNSGTAEPATPMPDPNDANRDGRR